MDILNKISDFVLNNMQSVVPSVALALEIIMRLLKTEKPMSLLLAAKRILQIAGAVVIKIGEIIGGLSAFIDKVIPQNTK